MLEKEEQTIGETTEGVDTQTTSETDTATAPSSDESRPDAKGDASQTDPAAPEALETVNQSLLALQVLFEKQIARNQNQNQMFDAIYREMKDYKENVLLEAFHKPIIHNLIRFYDDFVVIESQLSGIIETFESAETQSGSTSSGLFNKKRPHEPSDVMAKLSGDLSQFQINLENVRYELEEVLYRMDVTPYEEHPEKLDRKLHKTLKAIPTDNPDKDRDVAEIHKIGFYWREKVFRPEEVTIFRYNEKEEEVTNG